VPSVAQEENTEENDFDRIGRELDKLEAAKRVEGQAAEENTNIEENDFDKVGRELDKYIAEQRSKSDTVSWFLYTYLVLLCLLNSHLSLSFSIPCLYTIGQHVYAIFRREEWSYCRG